MLQALAQQSRPGIRYAQEILEHGIISAARDAPVCVAKTTQGSAKKNEECEDEEDLFIGGAHLMEAFYIAHAKDPTNVHVRHALTNGYENVNRLDSRSPPDVIE